MKRLQLASVALIAIMTLSSSALAGNIGGMRTDASTSVSYNAAGNIGGLRTEPNPTTTDFSTTVAGNIGGLLSLIMGSTLIP